MADGGGWQGDGGIGLAGAPSDARARFQAVLAEFAQGLASPAPMRRDTAVALVQQLDRLGRRMAAEHDTALARARELDAALAALTTKLEALSSASAAREAELAARIDGLVAELNEIRNAKRPAPVRTILAAVAAITALGGAVAGVASLTPPPPDPGDELVVAPVEEPPASLAPPPPPPLPLPVAAAEDIAPSPPATVPPPPPIPAAVRETYGSVAAALGRGDADAFSRLTRLAQSGDAKAQLRLALAYEAGDGGLSKDLPAARQWTLRAAAAGEPAAMYNAGQFLMEGAGGPKDLTGAARWFRRAALKGVVDAQYNLGLMYETGHGVARDVRQALRWYAMAGQAGDAMAQQKQTALQTALAASGPPAPSTAENEAPAPDAGVRGASVSETQAFLAQKGYYIGPIDGVVTPQLREAASAYMKDRPAIVPSR